MLKPCSKDLIQHCLFEPRQNPIYTLSFSCFPAFPGHLVALKVGNGPAERRSHAAARLQKDPAGGWIWPPCPQSRRLRVLAWLPRNSLVLGGLCRCSCKGFLAFKHVRIGDEEHVVKKVVELVALLSACC